MTPLRVQRDGAILGLTLDAPKGNVIDGAMIAALRAALREHGRAPGLKAVRLAAAGAHFSYGASVEEHRPERVRAMLGEFHALARELWDLCVPVVAAVRGQCLGGAFELVLTASFVVAAPDARFGVPEIRLGVFAPLASALLPRRVGLAHAERMLLSGEAVPAARALQIGLVDEIVEDPDAASLRLIQDRLLPKSASSLRFALRAARREARAALEQSLGDLERLYLDELMATHDAREGIEAFLEKRAPRWEAS